MPPAKLTEGSDLARLLPPDARIWVSGCSGHSSRLASLARSAAAALGAPTFTGIFVGGLNRERWAHGQAARVETFFLTAELKALGPRCTFLPFCYQDILAHLQASPPDAALFMVSPPNAEGRCSFGSCVDFLADLWPQIPIRIAHINPAMPRTRGDPGIPFDQITGCIEADEPLLEPKEQGTDVQSREIAAHVARFIPDGATVQTGLGKVPGAVLRALSSHSNLAIHSGLVGDAVLDLLEASALRPEQPITAGVAIGSARLYSALSQPAFSFRPPSVTHGLETLAALRAFTSVNSALEVDLFGQCYAELGPRGLISGPGGASDFSRGARASANGLRIVALPASAGGISRVVAPPGRGPVSLGRMDTDIIVTEWGAADLRGRDHDARARALIGIAAPEHRRALSEEWSAFSEANL